MSDLPHFVLFSEFGTSVLCVIFIMKLKSVLKRAFVTTGVAPASSVVSRVETAYTITFRLPAQQARRRSGRGGAALRDPRACVLGKAVWGSPYRSALVLSRPAVQCYTLIAWAGP
jgi:hypothetical protein